MHLSNNSCGLHHNKLAVTVEMTVLGGIPGETEIARATRNSCTYVQNKSVLCIVFISPLLTSPRGSKSQSVLKCVHIVNLMYME